MTKSDNSATSSAAS